MNPDKPAEPDNIKPAEPDNLTPAERAAAAFTLETSSASPQEAIWGRVAGGSSQSNGGVMHADPTQDYRWLRPTSYPADGRALHDARQRLHGRGFTPISGSLYKGPARREFVVNVPGAELWSRPHTLADEEWRADLARSCLDARYAEAYFRHCVAQGAPNKPYLPPELEYCMLVVHGLQPDTKRLHPTTDHIIHFARKVAVHPSGESRLDPVREAFAALKKRREK